MVVVVVSLREGSLMGMVDDTDTAADDGGGDIVDGRVGVVL